MTKLWKLKPHMTRAELVKVGLHLYGEQWVSPMARSLGIERRTIQRKLYNRSPIAGPMAIAIRALLKDKVLNV